ncbi:hypothetical protein UFOVP923_13 [uncultured Caudovirales phage]|uniref:Uncharacterized protein n=1 Tax=uncultured Caudovirales phage TaxID=2100421 RepID=A0A6J5PQL7_9CAUD|nr:hypothetical protein UFOVP923_13 [uncultured Caudovirales phage]
MTTNNDDEYLDKVIKELNIKFNSLAEENETTLVVEFHITKLGAKNMIAEWDLANEGDEEAFENSMVNYDFIVNSMEEQIYD